MFATMRRKRRSTKMKNELGQSVDHFKRAAALAAQETSATVGPRVNAARGFVQPAATKAKDAATSSWDTALATLTPLVAAATDNVRQTGKVSKKAAKANQKEADKAAKKIEKRANKAVGRKKNSGRGSKLVGFALLGTAAGIVGAYVVRRRQAAQWDEYEPSAPIASTTTTTVAPATVAPTTPVIVTDDTTFEPSDSTGATRTQD